jgi:hypothetical protein
MKLFNITIGKDKAVPFHEFRDIVRLTARRSYPTAKIENHDNGFNLTIDGKTQTCNLRALYSVYFKSPGQRDRLITEFLHKLVVDEPTYLWSEVVPLLRPQLKSAGFIREAQRSLAKQKNPDFLPSLPFHGDLHVIAVVDQPGQAWGVTQGLLDGWGVTLEQVMQHATTNLSTTRFPDPTNTLVAGSTGRKGTGVQEEVGLVFEGTYLTATWLILERFRDYLGQRLQGSFIVAVPSRSKLTAVRDDEPGMIASLVQSNRGFQSLSYPLTGQLFHVSLSTTGGEVTVYNPAGGAGRTEAQFTPGQDASLPSISQAAQGYQTTGGPGGAPVFSLNESTEEMPSRPSKKGPLGGR